MGFKMLLKVGGKVVKNNLPKILTGFAIASEVFGFWLMHKEAPIVHEKLKALPEDATLLDKAKVAVPVYLPALGMLVFSSGAMIGGCVVGDKKIATLNTKVAALNGLVATTAGVAQKYEEELVQAVGKDKFQEVKQNALNSALSDRNRGNEIVYTGHGDELFYFPEAGAWFASSATSVREGFSRANNQLTSGDSVSLREMCEYQDIPEWAIPKVADYIEWRPEDCSCAHRYGFNYSIDQPCSNLAPNGRSGIEIKIFDDMRTVKGDLVRLYN